MLKNYLITAFKMFSRRKFITFISLFGISVTLMVLMVVVAFLDAMFGPNPPETKQDRILGLYKIHWTNNEGTAYWNGAPDDKVLDFLDHNARDIPEVEKMSFIGKSYPASFDHNGERVQAYFKYADSVFWQIMEFTFIEGSPYTAEDVRNANKVAIINESTRNRLFGEEPAVEKNINGFRIVGVVRDVPFLKQISFSDVWVPANYTKDFALFLARSASDVPAIKAKFQMILKNMVGVSGIEGKKPDIRGIIWKKAYSRLETFFELKTRELFTNSSDFSWNRTYLTGNVEVGKNPWYVKTQNPFLIESSSIAMVMIIIAMILFMLLPTVNLVNINISRITERMSEIGVRKSFGASSRTLAGQFVTENIILTLAGGILGFIFTRLILYYITLSGWIPYAEFHMNYRVFLFALLLALFFGFMSGVYPAWKMSRLHPVTALRASITGGSK